MNSLNKKKIVYRVISFLILTCVYLVVAQRIGREREERFFIQFNSADIQGSLEYVRIGHHGCQFKIEGIEQEFVFYPKTGELNDYRIFDHVAKQGDLIIKEEHSDVLSLWKNGKVYQYRFRKPNE